MPKYSFIVGLLLIVVSAQSQVSLDYLKNKAKDKVNEKLDKKQKEFDESNFNYAILFLDNSGAFEADEKGLSISSNITNSSKLLNKTEKTIEERAYTSLRNGELLYSGNRFYLAEQSFRLAKLLYEESGYTSTTNYGQTTWRLSITLSIKRYEYKS